MFRFFWQLNLFANRLNGEPIGVSVLGIFVINKNTILTVGPTLRCLHRVRKKEAAFSMHNFIKCRYSFVIYAKQHQRSNEKLTVQQQSTSMLLLYVVKWNALL